PGPPVPPSDVCVGATFTSHRAAGAGTPANPYVLCTTAQLSALAADSAAWASAFRLGADIDFSGVSFGGIGDSAVPFAGSFDGAHHHVKSLHVTSSEIDGRDVGFFGVIAGSAAYVHDLVFDDATVDAAHSQGVGILAGRLDRGRVINCSTSGTVHGDV